MDKKLLKQYLNRTGFQRAGLATLSSAPWYRGVSQPGVLKAPRGFTGMQDVLKYEAPAAGAGIALALRQKDRDKPVTTETEEPKLPEQKPPEGPDIVSEIVATEAALRTEEKIKNKIKTWEKYMSRDEAEKAVKENNITLKDLEIPALKKQITFRKTGDGFVILFDRKEVGELVDITQLKQEANEQEGNTRSYQMSVINKEGSKGEPYDTFDGEKNAKDFAKDDIAKALLRETEDSDYPSLRDIFQNLEYNKKGEPKAVAEELERLQKELAEREKNKKAMGGLMDKPLTGRSRYI